jgi:hypothetical protein
MTLKRLAAIAIVALSAAMLALPAAALAWQAKGGKVVLPGPADVPPAKRTAKEPQGPADFRSAHFLLHTDLPPREARELLDRLESMLALVSKYWGRPPSGVIECYVVKELDVWPADALDAEGRAKIAQGAGITHVDTLSRGSKTLAARAVVYAVADRGTPQHEAVHAYCGQTFGRTGPLWYSEGMAEMGQYWREGDVSVQCPAYVVEYLRAAVPKPLAKILDEKDIAPRGGPGRTGDSWRNYAWRWALCHLLANNPNYAQRFRPLGLGYLSGANVSFADTYGAMAREIDFEYRFFLEHVERGYRVDLCSWDWQRKFREPAGEVPVRARIAANRGWQPTGALVRRGAAYDLAAKGHWQIAPMDGDVAAAGGEDGAGRLEGVIFHDFTLGEPFELSNEGTFVAPADGRLYARCRDAWNELADNTGSVALAIYAADAKNRPGPADPE